MKAPSPIPITFPMDRAAMERIAAFERGKASAAFHAAYTAARTAKNCPIQIDEAAARSVIASELLIVEASVTGTKAAREVERRTIEKNKADAKFLAELQSFAARMERDRDVLEEAIGDYSFDEGDTPIEELRRVAADAARLTISLDLMLASQASAMVGDKTDHHARAFVHAMRRAWLQMTGKSAPRDGGMMLRSFAIAVWSDFGGRQRDDMDQWFEKLFKRNPEPI